MELVEKQRMRWGTLVLLLLISVIGGLFIWNRPVKPLWVDNARVGISWYLGCRPMVIWQVWIPILV